jgi:hypothetical protein
MSFKSSILKFSGTIQSSGSTYNNPVDTQLVSVIANQSVFTGVVNQYTLAGQYIILRFWLGLSSGPGSNYSWRASEFQFYDTRVSSWIGQTLDVTIDVNQPSTIETSPGIFENVSFTVSEFKINGTSQTFDPDLTSNSPAPTTTTRYSGEGDRVVMADYTSGSPFSFPGSQSLLESAEASLLGQTTAALTGNLVSAISSEMLSSTGIIAAPGPIKLGLAILGSDSNTDGDELDYIDPGYFDGIYILPRDYYGFSAGVIQGAEATLVNDSLFQCASGLILSTANADILASSTTDIFAGIIRATTYDFVSDTELAVEASHILGTDVLVSGSSTSTQLARNILDIGIQYASDWVGIDQDYVGPYFYLDLLIQSQLYAAASVEVVPEANILADSTIQGNGGYFISFAQSLLSADSQFNLQPFLTGGAGVIYSTAADLSVDSDQSVLGGRIYDMASAMSADTNFSQDAGRIQLAQSLMNAITAFTPQSDLFKSTTISLVSDASVITQGGKYWSAQVSLLSDFTIPAILGRIISIDEYYIDKVTREIRTIVVFDEQRTIFIPIESQTITVFDEDRINQVDYERRLLRPEPGTPIQVGSRNRRITA